MDKESLEKSKNAIHQRLDEILKTALHQYFCEDKLSFDSIQAICDVIETAFIHGLKNEFLFKGPKSFDHLEPNFWPFVARFPHRSADLKQIKNEVSRSRAWIRIALNESRLEYYFNLLSKNIQYLEDIYLKNAFLRDRKCFEALLKHSKTLTKLPINAPINSTSLNIWLEAPLILAGLIPEMHKQHNHSLELADDALSVLDDDGLVNSRPISSFSNPLFIGDETSSIFSSHGGSTLAINSFEAEDAFSREVVVNRRKTTKIRRNPNIKVIEKTSSQNQLMPHLYPIEVIPQISTSLPTGWGLLPLNELDDIFNTSEAASGNGNDLESTSLSFAEPLFSLEDFNNKNYLSSSLIEPTTIFGQLDDGLELKELTIHALSDINNVIEASSININESSDSIFSHLNQINDDTLLAIDVSLMDSGLSLSPRKDCSASSLPLSECDDVNHCVSYNNYDDFLKNDQDRGENIPSINAETIIEDASVFLNQQSEIMVHKAVERSEEVEQTETTKSEQIKKTKSESFIVDEKKISTDADEYGISQKLLKILTEIPTIKSLTDQNFRCHSCWKCIGKDYEKYNLCGLDAQYYCNECWNKGDESIIPSRVLLNWDYKRRPISKLSKAFLRANSDRPVIRIDKINPQLYSKSKRMTKILKLRERLNLVVAYLLTCKESIAEDFKQRIHPQDYFYTDIHLYSITDLRNVISGVLERRLNTLINFAISHIKSCYLCLQKGFICEICSTQKIIYSFDTDIADRCKECGAVYHIKCFKNVKCPKCIRRAKHDANKFIDILLQ